jgi:hypothetical protein
LHVVERFKVTNDGKTLWVLAGPQQFQPAAAVSYG